MQMFTKRRNRDPYFFPLERCLLAAAARCGAQSRWPSKQKERIYLYGGTPRVFVIVEKPSYRNDDAATSLKLLRLQMQLCFCHWVTSCEKRKQIKAQQSNQSWRHLPVGSTANVMRTWNDGDAHLELNNINTQFSASWGSSCFKEELNFVANLFFSRNKQNSS